MLIDANHQGSRRPCFVGFLDGNFVSRPAPPSEKRSRESQLAGVRHTAPRQHTTSNSVCQSGMAWLGPPRAYRVASNQSKADCRDGWHAWHALEEGVCAASGGWAGRACRQFASNAYSPAHIAAFRIMSMREQSEIIILPTSARQAFNIDNFQASWRVNLLQRCFVYIQPRHAFTGTSPLRLVRHIWAPRQNGRS